MKTKKNRTLDPKFSAHANVETANVALTNSSARIEGSSFVESNFARHSKRTGALILTLAVANFLASLPASAQTPEASPIAPTTVAASQNDKSSTRSSEDSAQNSTTQALPTTTASVSGTSSDGTPMSATTSTGVGVNATNATPNAAATNIATLPVVSARGTAVANLADARNNDDVTAPVLTLADSLTMALENNPTIGAAQAALRAAQLRVGTARSAGGVQVDASGNAGLSRSYGGTTSSFSGGTGTGGTGGGSGTGGSGTGGSGTGGSGTGGSGGTVSTSNRFLGFDSTQSLGVTATLPVYNGGRVKASTRSARTAVDIQAANALQIEQDLLLNTTTSYLNVLRSQQLLQVAGSNESISQEQLRIAQVRYDAGAAARLEVFQAQATLADAQQRRTAASATLGQSNATLNTLMGRVPETPLRVEPISALDLNLPTPNADNASLSSADLRAQAAQTRPALALSNAQIANAQANVDVAKAQRKPSLGLSLGALLRNPVTFAGRFALSLGLGLSQSIFDNGRSASQIGEAQALLAQSRFNQTSQQLGVGNQIEQSLLSLDSAQARIGSADVAVTSAQEALRAAQLGYQAGVRTSIEVSNAQTALLSAQTNAVNARFDVATAQAQLASAVGVLPSAGQDAATRAQDTIARQQAQAGLDASANSKTSKKKRKKFLGIF